MKKKLIVNADDFGLTPGVNHGIVEAFTNGVLTSTTLMVNQPYAIDAIELAKKFEKLGIGIHLTFDKGKALTGVSSLTDENGNLQKFSYLNEHGTEEDFFNEAKAQIERFIELVGRKPTHIDSHHHIHIKAENAYKATLRLCEIYGLKHRTNEEMISSFYDKNVSLEYLIEKLKEKETDIVEVMSHPGFPDKALFATSSYNSKREEELEILKNEELKKFVEENFILVDFLGNIK